MKPAISTAPAMPAPAFRPPARPGLPTATPTGEPLLAFADTFAIIEEGAAGDVALAGADLPTDEAVALADDTTAGAMPLPTDALRPPTAATVPAGYGMLLAAQRLPAAVGEAAGVPAGGDAGGKMEGGAGNLRGRAALASVVIPLPRKLQDDSAAPRLAGSAAQTSDAAPARSPGVQPAARAEVTQAAMPAADQPDNPVAPVVPVAAPAVPGKLAEAALPLKLQGAAETWRRPLLEALGERIQIALGKRSEQALIRLDPPMMGSVEIAIRHQGGVLQVHLSASNDDVLRQLQSIGDSLRQDLGQRQYSEVTVHVGAGGRDGDGRQRPDGTPEDKRPGRALAEGDRGQDPSTFVLVSSDRE